VEAEIKAVKNQLPLGARFHSSITFFYASGVAGPMGFEPMTFSLEG
jgi:hypothetical protein